jgi:hypothetical protein
MSRSLLVLALVSGCAPVEVELGQGIVAFAPLEDGDEVELVQGPQGGHHIWTGLRVRGLDEDAGAFAELWVELDGHVADHSRVRPLFHIVDERREAAGLTCLVQSPERLRGRDIVLGARLEGIEDRRRVRVRSR